MLYHEYEGNARKRRDRLYIIADILKAARKGVLKTEVMYKAGLSFPQLGGYLSLLARLGLIEVSAKNGKLAYKTTAKGIRYLKCYEEISHLLKESNKHNIPSSSSPLSYP